MRPSDPVGAGCPVLDLSCPIWRGERVDIWKQSLVVAQTGFHFKSLCDFTVNPFMGCGHGCPFCYVPEVSAAKQKSALEPYGVRDPDAEWGQYALLRMWDEKEFRQSLMKMCRIPPGKLMQGGHRAIMLSSTTDAYQHIRHPDSERAKELNAYRAYMVCKALEIIRDESDLRVRIQSRFTLAENDLELLVSYGPRLLLGTSIVTLDRSIGQLYEPHVPDAERRLEMLRKASAAGVNVYVAFAPVPPHCDEADVRRTLQAIAQVKPCTVFCESLNVRGGNLERIRKRAAELVVDSRMDLFENAAEVPAYSLRTLKMVERVAAEVGLAERLHLWPDKEVLGGKTAYAGVADPAEHAAWLLKWWNRVSEWPETTSAHQASPCGSDTATSIIPATTLDTVPIVTATTI